MTGNNLFLEDTTWGENDKSQPIVLALRRTHIFGITGRDERENVCSLLLT